jgi:tetratricopeptide (TPR) repeat protein
LRDVAAEWYEYLDMPPEAEALFRAIATEVKDPRAPLVLARYLGRRGRVAEGLEICSKAIGQAQPEDVAYTMAAVARHKNTTTAQHAEVERWLTDLEEKHPDSQRLKIYIAEYLDQRGSHDLAISRLEALRRKDPGNAIVLNNLAYLLAMNKRTDEALPLIEEALQITGPVATILNTRAVVHLEAGRPAKAESDLQTAVSQNRSAMSFFHMARVQLALGKRELAQREFEKALCRGLTAQDLHPLERPRFLELQGLGKAP